jgi:hypothetical protein
MTRKDMLRYLEKNHGAALAQVGLIAVDTQESLYYVIDDAMRMRSVCGAIDIRPARCAWH